jgi:2-polyprenyl-3-methyl-5-hydroxy-6-metoxy-1,4-benzoquinol methylase
MVATSCKICGGRSEFFTSVDRAKHCNLQIPSVYSNSTESVDYYRCSLCGFIFTTFIDTYSNSDLQELIYNDDYVKFDPLYPRIRPETNARFLRALLSESFGPAGRPRVLDYGAGSGLLSRLLADEFTVENYDALNPEFDVLPAGPFDVIFSAEVAEHMPFPTVFADEWRTCLSDLGCVIFSTKTQPDDIEVQRGDWWYLGPRNGHVSLYSGRSLAALFAPVGMACESLSEDWHIAYRDPGHVVDIQTLRRSMALLPTGFVMV